MVCKKRGGHLQQLGLAEARVPDDQHVDVAAQGDAARRPPALLHPAQHRQQDARLQGRQKVVSLEVS